MNKSNIILLILILLTFSCNKKSNNAEEKASKLNVPKIDLKEIIGNTYRWNYSTLIYDITIISDSTLHWKLIKGDFPGATEETEKYIHSKLYDNVYFFSWTEKSGLGLYNVLDFKTNKLTTHGNHDGDMYVSYGTFEKTNK